MTLVYFAPVPWNSYEQRPHYTVRYLLNRWDGRVVWIDPYPARFPAFKDLRTASLRTNISTPLPVGLTVLGLRTIPLEPLDTGRWLNRTFVWNRFFRRVLSLLKGEKPAVGIGRPSALALAALSVLEPAWSFYDAMDDFPQFYQGVARRFAQSCEQSIATTVDVLFASSSSLWAKFSWRGSSRVMMHNAFAMASLPPPGTSQKGLRVLGYVGCVGDWFDWPLVVRLAEAHPDKLVHIVGPRFVGPSRSVPPNVRLFPACSHDQAVNHLQTFSVGLIPFKRTQLTDSVDPVKYYGYRGMGLPVLTTTFGEMALRGINDCTYFLDDAGGLDRAVTAALGRVVQPCLVQKFRDDHTWERRFDEAGLADRVPV